MAGLTFTESVKMNLILLQIPFFLVYVSLFRRRSKRANGRPLPRVLGDEVAYFILSRLSVRQLQAVSGSTLEGYAKWAKQNKVAQVLDDLDHDARLMWVGPKETDNVLIYCHGGGFVGPLSDFQVEFWYRIQQAILKSHGIKLGVAILQYSTYPAAFPMQLNQLQAAIQLIMSMGVSPSKICLAGDSAGGNLILQLLAHTLHPSSLVAHSPASASIPFAGICLISPWTFPSSVRKDNDSYDLVPAHILEGRWMDTYLSPVSDLHLPYVQFESAPQGWFDGLDKIANRILITAGRKEVLYDSIVRLSQAFEKAHSNVELDVQENGVHCDAMFDIAAKSKVPHATEARVANWFSEVLRETTA